MTEARIGWTFQALWPITDQSVPWHELIDQARADLPQLLATARAIPLERGKFHIARSIDVPGSGRSTPTVLVFEARAKRRRARAYHHATTQERTAS